MPVSKSIDPFEDFAVTTTDLSFTLVSKNLYMSILEASKQFSVDSSFFLADSRPLFFLGSSCKSVGGENGRNN